MIVAGWCIGGPFKNPVRGNKIIKSRMDKTKVLL